MEEIKEITLRGWVSELVTMILMLIILTGTIVVAGYNPQVNTSGEQLLFTENFNVNNTENLKVHIINSNYVLSNGKLTNRFTPNLVYSSPNSESNTPSVNGANYVNVTAITIPKLANAGYYKITFNATVVAPFLVVESMNNKMVSGNKIVTLNAKGTELMSDFGIVGVGTSKNMENTIPMNSEINWAVITAYNSTMTANNGGRVLRSDSEAYPMAYNVYPNNNLLVTSSTDTIGGIFGGSIFINSQFRSILPKENMVSIAHDRRGSMFSWELNVQYSFILNFKYPSASYIQITYISKLNNMQNTIKIPLNNAVLTNDNKYITLYLLHTYSSQFNLEGGRFSGIPVIKSPVSYHPLSAYVVGGIVNATGVMTMDNLNVYGGDVQVSPNVLFGGVALILGFIMSLGVGIIAITKDGSLNSMEMFLVSIGITGIVALMLLYFMPTLWLNPYTLGLTLLTFGLLAIWLLFKSGRIEFKGEIDEFFANHGDALFFAVLVLTIIQYIFVIF